MTTAVVTQDTLPLTQDNVLNQRNILSDEVQKIKEKRQATAYVSVGTDKKLATFFKSAAAGAAIGFGVKTASHSLVALSSLSGPAGIFASAALVSTFMTGIEVTKDYRQARKALEMSRTQALRSVFNRKAKYGKKFGISFVGGTVGASAVWGLFETDTGQVVKNFVVENAGVAKELVMAMAGSFLSDSIAPNQNIASDKTATAPTALATEPPAVTEGPSAEELAAAEARGNKITEITKDAPLEGWAGTIAYLDNAREGDLESIVSLAELYRYGGGAVPIDIEKAEAILQVAIDDGYKISDNTPAPAEAETTPQPEPAAMPIKEMIAEIDGNSLHGKAKEAYDAIQTAIEAGRPPPPWAPINLAYTGLYEQGGMTGLSRDEVRSLAGISAEMGDPAANRFLAGLDKMEDKAPTAPVAVAPEPVAPAPKEVAQQPSKPEAPAPNPAPSNDNTLDKEIERLARQYPDLLEDAAPAPAPTPANTNSGLDGFSNADLQRILNTSAPTQAAAEPKSGLSRLFCQIKDTVGGIKQAVECHKVNVFKPGPGVFEIPYSDDPAQTVARDISDYIRIKSATPGPNMAALR